MQVFCFYAPNHFFVWLTDKSISFFSCFAMHQHQHLPCPQSFLYSFLPVLLSLTHTRLTLLHFSFLCHFLFQLYISSVTATHEINDETAVPMENFSDCLNVQHTTTAKKRRKGSSETQQDKLLFKDASQTALEQQVSQWKRIMLLVVAITVHNIPEGTSCHQFFINFFHNHENFCRPCRWSQFWRHWKN